MAVNNLNIHHLNANSIRSKTKQHFMDDYLKEHKPSALFDNYSLYRNDRTTDNGGGTAILIREDIFTEPLKAPPNCNIECTVVRIKMKNNQSLTLVAAYFPNQTLGNDDLNNIWNHFGKNNVILAGDLNAKHTSWNNNNNNPNGTVLYNWAHDNITSCCVKYPDEPTCIRDNTNPSTIDGFIVSSDINQICNNQIQTHDFFSDHRAISMQVLLESETIIVEPQLVWNWDQCDWDKFNQIIDRELKNSAIPDNINIDKDQIDSFVSKIESIFENALKESCPKVKLNLSRLIKLSKRSLALIHRKKKIRRKLFRHRNDANALAELKMLNNMIFNSIADDYRINFMNKIKSISTSNPNIFREIQRISNYKKREGLPSIMTNDDSAIYKTDQEKANGFATQFASVNHINTEHEEFEDFNMMVEHEVDTWFERNENQTIVEFSDEIRASDPYAYMNIIGRDPSNKFISPTNLKAITKSRNNKKSTGGDGITNQMLKVLSPNTIIFLTILFNHIINLGYYPKNWRHGIVIPVPKKGKPKNKISSYRPIQLLSNLSKIMEKHISDTILGYNRKFNIFPKQQFAYQSGKSTTHPLVKLSHAITNNLNCEIQTPTFIMTLDFEKAFDLLWIKGLIWKCLNQFNFSNATAKILYNFMKERSFQTIVNGTKSNITEVNKGSPQGSSISAFAFLLYTADFPEPEIENIKTLRYADDVVVVVSNRNVYQAERDLNEYLGNVVYYTKKFRLKLNKTKCELMFVLGRWKDIGARVRRLLKDMIIRIENVVLEPKDEIKYLGIIYNKQFNFRKHID